MLLIYSFRRLFYFSKNKSRLLMKQVVMSILSRNSTLSLNYNFLDLYYYQLLLILYINNRAFVTIFNDRTNIFFPLLINLVKINTNIPSQGSQGDKLAVLTQINYLRLLFQLVNSMRKFICNLLLFVSR